MFVCILCNCVCLAIIVRGEDGAKKMQMEERNVIPSSLASNIISGYMYMRLRTGDRGEGDGSIKVYRRGVQRPNSCT